MVAEVETREKVSPNIQLIDASGNAGPAMIVGADGVETVIAN